MFVNYKRVSGCFFPSFSKLRKICYHPTTSGNLETEKEEEIVENVTEEISENEPDSDNNNKLVEELTTKPDPHYASYCCFAVYYDGNKY